MMSPNTLINYVVLLANGSLIVWYKRCVAIILRMKTTCVNNCEFSFSFFFISSANQGNEVDSRLLIGSYVFKVSLEESF